LKAGELYNKSNHLKQQQQQQQQQQQHQQQRCFNKPEHYFPDVINAQNPCDAIPCQNGGTCYDVAGTTTFTCNCPDGYLGDQCEIG